MANARAAKPRGAVMAPRFSFATGFHAGKGCRFLAARCGDQPAVRSFTVVVGPLLRTEAMPVARDAAEAYIWLVPIT